jgi:hypothetical protein
MKLRLSILLLAAALAASPAAGQTIKSLGFNTSNGVVPTTALSNLPLTFTNLGGIVGVNFSSGNVLVNSNTVTFYGTNSGLAFSAGANASQIRNQIGLGATNAVTFSNITASGTLAVTGNATFSGVNNTATAQTASSASSLMTRELSDARYFGLKSHSINFAMMATKTASGGSSSSFRGAWQIFTATNTSSFASAYGSWGYMLGLPSSEHYVNFASPFSILFSRASQATRAGLVQYVQVGRDMTSINATNTKLAQKGVGIQFGSNGATPFIHNGTSLTDGSLITNASTYNRFVLRWVPATAFEVYGVVNGSEPVLLGSVTSNLPTGIGVSDSVLEFSQLDSGSGGANAWFWLNTAHIITP